MAKRKKQSGSNQDAVFTGWQETPEGKSLKLYTIMSKENPFYGSTVTEPTLRKLDLQIPETPYRENETNDFRSSDSEGKRSEG